MYVGLVEPGFRKSHIKRSGFFVPKGREPWCCNNSFDIINKNCTHSPGHAINEIDEKTAGIAAGAQ